MNFNCRQTRTSVYTTVERLIESPEDLFEFIYYHKKIFNKKPHGMGRGMKRVINNWYIKQDPYDLALEVTRVHSRHRHSHADLIRLSRLSSKACNDVGTGVVLTSIIRGIAKTQAIYKNQASAQPVVEYLTVVRNFNMCTNVDEAVEMIENHSFDLETVSTELRSHSRVWEHALPRTPLRSVLANLKVMTKKNFLSQENHPVLVKLLDMLRDQIALIASKLDPLEILEILAQTERNWELPSSGSQKHKKSFEDNVPKHKPHPFVAQELNRMMTSSFLCVPKVPMSMILCIDVKSDLKGECYGCWNLTISRALSVFILSMIHASTDLTVIYCSEDEKDPIKIIPITIGKDVHH